MRVPIFNYGTTLLLIILIASIVKAQGLLINITSSMPVGFYKQVEKRPIHHGDIVSVCLPFPIAREGLIHGYLFKGHCPGGAIAVLKQVIATPGDRVQLTQKAIVVNGRRYNAPIHEYDRYNRWIRRFVKKGIIHTKKYWLYGTNNPIYSWDSRYYGGVSVSCIQGVYFPVLSLY